MLCTSHVVSFVVKKPISMSKPNSMYGSFYAIVMIVGSLFLAVMVSEPHTFTFTAR